MALPNLLKIHGARMATRSSDHRALRFFVTGALVCSVGAAAAQSTAAIAETYPSGSILSVAAADAALAAVAAARSRIDIEYGNEVRTCRSTFFVSRCIESAKEWRRNEMMPLEAVQLEAARFKRLARVQQRDEALRLRHVSR